MQPACCHGDCRCLLHCVCTTTSRRETILILWQCLDWCIDILLIVYQYTQCVSTHSVLESTYTSDTFIKFTQHTHMGCSFHRYQTTSLLSLLTQNNHNMLTTPTHFIHSFCRVVDYCWVDKVTRNLHSHSHDPPADDLSTLHLAVDSGGSHELGKGRHNEGVSRLGEEGYRATVQPWLDVSAVLPPTET